MRPGWFPAQLAEQGISKDPRLEVVVLNGVRAVRKEDLLKAIPNMKAYFASMGLSETHLHSVEAVAVDSKYLLARAGWRMPLKDQNGDCKQVDASATYVLERKDADTLCIVLQIDHQDLATLIGNHQN